MLTSSASPLAILMDDLHFADPATIGLLEQLVRRTLGFRILFAGSFRDPHIDKEHPALARAIIHLSHDRLLDLITVRRLSYDETSAFLTEALAQPAAEDLVAFAHRRTKGSPRLLNGLVRSLGGRLELQEEIGAGSMGRVFRAYECEGPGRPWPPS